MRIDVLLDLFVLYYSNTYHFEVNFKFNLSLRKCFLIKTFFSHAKANINEYCYSR